MWGVVDGDEGRSGIKGVDDGRIVLIRGNWWIFRDEGILRVDHSEDSCEL